MPWKDAASRKAYHRRYYLRNRDKILARTAANHKDYSVDKRDRLRRLKESGPCVDCGAIMKADFMEFDHRPGEQKVASVCAMLGRQWSVIEAEIAKCDLVCLACHRLRTRGRRLEKYSAAL